MQPNDPRRFPLVKMATHRVADLLAKCVQRLRFGKDGLTQSASGEAAFPSFLDDKNDFVHALQSNAPLDSARFTVNSQGRSRETDCVPRAKSNRSLNNELSTVFPFFLLLPSYFVKLLPTSDFPDASRRRALAAHTRKLKD